MNKSALALLLLLPGLAWANTTLVSIQQTYQNNALNLSCLSSDTCSIAATATGHPSFSLNTLLNSNSYIRWLMDGNALVTTPAVAGDQNILVNFQNQQITPIQGQIFALASAQEAYLTMANKTMLFCSLSAKNCYHIPELDGYSAKSSLLQFFFDQNHNLYVTNSDTSCHMYHFDYHWLANNTTTPNIQTADKHVVNPDSSMCWSHSSSSTATGARKMLNTRNEALCICDSNLNCGTYIYAIHGPNLSLDSSLDDLGLPQDDCSKLHYSPLSDKILRVTTGNEDPNQPTPAGTFYVNAGIPFVNNIYHEILFSITPPLSVRWEQSGNEIVFAVVNYSLANGGTQFIEPEADHPNKKLHIFSAQLSQDKGTWNLHIHFKNDQGQSIYLNTPIQMDVLNQLANTLNGLNLSSDPGDADKGMGESYAYSTTGKVFDLGNFTWHLTQFKMENDNWASSNMDCGTYCYGDSYFRFDPYSLTHFSNDHDVDFDHNIILYDGCANNNGNITEIVSRISDKTKAVQITFPNSKEQSFQDPDMNVSAEDRGVRIVFNDDDNHAHTFFVPYSKLDSADYRSCNS